MESSNSNLSTTSINGIEGQGTDIGHGKRLSDDQLNAELDRWYDILHAQNPELYEHTRFELIVNNRLGPNYPPEKRRRLREACKYGERLCTLFSGSALSEGERSAMRARPLRRVLNNKELVAWASWPKWVLEGHAKENEVYNELK